MSLATSLTPGQQARAALLDVQIRFEPDFGLTRFIVYHMRKKDEHGLPMVLVTVSTQAFATFRTPDDALDAAADPSMRYKWI